jgi:hypothetical protein
MYLTSFLIPIAASSDALLLVYHHDTLSVSCNLTKRNLMGLSWKAKCAKPQVHLFLSIFLHKLQSKTLLLLC